MAQTAGIVIIGDEILSGKFADENAVFLIEQLRALGLSLQRVAIIPDVVDDIAATVKSFSDRFDHVFTSGGVGPTHDDLTMEGVAKGFDVEVVIHEQLAASVRAFFGPELGEKNLRLAEVPEGAQLVGRDDELKWPVTKFNNVYVLPGVPSLFRRKFAAIKSLFTDTPWAVERIYCTGDEGSLAPHMDAVNSAYDGVTVGSYPRFGEPDYRVLITLESKDRAAVTAAREDLAARLGDLVVRVEKAS